MTGQPWTPAEDRLLRKLNDKASRAAIAARLGRSVYAVRTRMARLGLRTRQNWSPAELAELRSLYPTSTAAELAAHFGRPAKSVWNAAKHHGLTKQSRADVGEEFLERLRELNADGHCDADIAEALGCARHTAGRWRRGLGLPCHARGERYRAKVRIRTAEQLEAAGLPSLAMVRVRAFEGFAKGRGWPADLPPRAVMILDAFAARGPLTRKQLAEAIGMEWHGSRDSLKSGTPRGTYLAELISRGLVVNLGKVVRGVGKGHSTHLYTLAPTAFPKETGHEPEAIQSAD